MCVMAVTVAARTVSSSTPRSPTTSCSPTVATPYAPDGDDGLPFFNDLTLGCVAALRAQQVAGLEAHRVRGRREVLQLLLAAAREHAVALQQRDSGREA